MELKNLTGYNLINKIKHDLDYLFAYDLEKKKLHNILENHLASIKQQINIFSGMSKCFDDLSRINAAQSAIKSKDDSEFNFFSDKFFQTTVNVSHKYKTFAQKSNDYAEILNLINEKANKTKELIIFGKYFSKLFDYEKKIENRSDER